MNLSFRKDIHALRGYAILIVLANHFFPDSFPNSFVGVDIFFVISGFVVSLSILKHIQTVGQFSARSFLVRRIFRLAPALWIYATLIFILFSLVISSKYLVEYSSFSRTGLSSLVGLSNIYLLKQSTDYFASSALLNPFAHTWSLSIEEQFYIIFAVLISAFNRFGASAINKKNLLCLLITITCASYLFFLRLTNSDQSSAYYSSFSRVWELCVGVLAFAICFLHTNNLPIRAYSSTIVRILAVLTLVFASFSNEISRYTAVQFAVVGAFFFVVGGQLYYFNSKPATNTISQWFCKYTDLLLTTRYLQYLGTISYSLYLWHWGVLSFFSWTITLDSTRNIAFACAISFLCAHISYYSLEKPFSSLFLLWQSPSRSYIPLLASPAFALILVPFGIPRFSNLFYIGRDILHAREADSCQHYFATQPPSEIKLISSQALQQYKFLIVGDSHAGSFNDLARTSCYFSEKSVSIIAKAGTPFPPLYYEYSLHSRSLKDSLQESQAMAKRFEYAIDYMSTPAPLTHHSFSNRGHSGSKLNVILISRLPLYFSTQRQGLDDPTKIQAFSSHQFKPISQAQSLSQWILSIETLARSNPRIMFTVFSPLPYFTNLYPSVLCVKQPYRPNISRNCFQSVTMKDFKSSVYSITQSLTDLSKRVDNVYVYDPSRSICNVASSSATCLSHLSGLSLFLDTSHLSHKGSQVVFHDYLKWLVSEASTHKPFAY